MHVSALANAFFVPDDQHLDLHAMHFDQHDLVHGYDIMPIDLTEHGEEDLSAKEELGLGPNEHM